jgi:hypothetical protein
MMLILMMLRLFHYFAIISPYAMPNHAIVIAITLLPLLMLFDFHFDDINIIDIIIDSDIIIIISR